ncbi:MULTISPECIES: alpha/beta hydrolase [unclassified Mycobacterium]|uniref:alpha/beta fold hydrolase n=1 Tax=unclassified Mycobacterium TaxID=2642494 RepID=UPI0029C8ED5D|nr:MULTISPECIES: alpha/beta hydrolase [unclassified Mycobacterium]
MFRGFTVQDVDVGGVRIHARVGGEGPPVLLLHGYPQTHVIWCHVAQALAQAHTVVASDLRGYGDSGKPASEADHSSYSKRAMAADQVGLMTALGHERFAIVGHDRGARVAHRLCLDHAERVERAAVLDIVPTRHVFANVDRALATFYDHWFFLAEQPDMPEVLIGGAPEYFLRRKLDQWSGPHAMFDVEAVSEYVRCFSDPETIRASCEDYRAAASIDLEHDDADATAGRRVTCPLLVLWGERGFVGANYDVLRVWRHYADDVGGRGLDCGHFVPEEAPEQTVAALREFLAQS